MGRTAYSRSRGGGTRTPGLRFWRPPLYQLSYAPSGWEDCSRGFFELPPRMSQRRVLGALFTVLALGLAGIAVAAADGAGGAFGRWIIVVAAAALAIWLGSMAFRALR
jgi:hypothetical protein